jgi:hypothetical protein
MGTSSTIAILNKDGTIEQINAHYDGGIAHNGTLLIVHYRDPQKIKELIKLGDLSALKKEVHPPLGQEHSFKTPIEDVTIFYMRDRGENSCKSNKFNSFEDYLAVGIQDPYNYIYDEKKSKWFFVDPYEFEIVNEVTMESKVAKQPLAKLVKTYENVMIARVKSDYIQYKKELKIEREYRKLKKELPNQEVTSKKLKI